ncbi:MAG: hypothetical protein IPG75_06380 [Gemmatimonadetes bacterium]|nr:hypothetical protein [Gemmatimonadota bacterium]
MSLTDDELRDILARAEELDSVARRGAERTADVAALIGAAEEVGLSRRAVERALAERLDLPLAPPTVGSLAWARSIDGRCYVAEVLATTPESTQVRFLRGGEHAIPTEGVRPCGFLPGERVSCDWPMWGPWTGTVVAYTPERQRIKLSDGWGSTRTFRVSEVWLAPAAAAPERDRRRASMVLLGIGGAVGALLGSLLTALLLR